ncbi:MAG: hypothetical protein CMD29_02565 [Flavobacteriales bacterium]|jgi:nucleoside-diphosphate-sugar epimerase|nr:hypothetical protein [Flavobacteriales bacterium]
MKIFVTGATGFIGSHFVNFAISEGHEIFALKRQNRSPKIKINGKINWIIKEFNQVSVNDFKNIQVIVHLAANGVSPKVSSWVDCFSFNVHESIMLIKLAIKAGVRRYVLSGSYAEYGKSALDFDFIPVEAPLNPTDIYSASKAAASVAFKALSVIEKIELIYLRFPIIYGKGQYEKNFWPSLKKAAITGMDFKMTKGEQVRDFMSVENLAEIILSSCRREDLIPGDPIFKNVGTGNPQTLKSFAQHWWRKWDAKGKLEVGKLAYRDNEVMRYVLKI